MTEDVPISKVKNIMRKVPSLSQLSSESVENLSYSTDLFLRDLVRCTKRRLESNNSTRFNVKAIQIAIENEKSFEILKNVRVDMPVRAPSRKRVKKTDPAIVASSQVDNATSIPLTIEKWDLNKNDSESDDSNYDE